MKRSIEWFLLGWLGLAASAAIGAEVHTGALVTQVQGMVNIAGKDGMAVPVRSFAKYLPGDRVTLEAGAKLRVIYVSNGRQETWTDAAQIEIGAAETKLIGQGSPPEVVNLPPYLVKTLTKSPNVIADIQNRQGMVRLRALPPGTQLATAWKQYDELRRASTDDDITPELHLLVTLQELKTYADIKEVLAEMLRRQPDNAEIKDMNERYIAATPKS